MRYKRILEFHNYDIYDDGHVYSYNIQRFLKPRFGRKQYLIVALCKNGIQKNRRIARLVAQAFIPNPENKPCVNHIDGDKNNNNFTNLEWVTHKENDTHARKMGLIKPYINKKGNPKLTIEDVKEIRSKCPPLLLWRFAEKHNVTYQTIYNIVKRISWKNV